METRCRIFARTSEGYVDTGEKMALNLSEYPVLMITVNGKKVVGFAISESLVAVPANFLS
ncbi:MAG: hypothetical protein J7J46_06340 [Candidatus Desulfofervidus sp.]|nr:hypothetical protein [Candidatus Desulfofervidus sp.]